MKQFHFESVSSTNIVAKELLDKYPEVVVTSNNQTSGYGRTGHQWYGNPGENVYCSFGITHEKQLSIEDLSLFQAIGCLIVKHTLSEFASDDDFRIKWPNDIYAKIKMINKYEYKKICGVIVEHSFIGNRCSNTIIGIGINCLQAEFPETIKQNAVSLLQLGYMVDPQKVIVSLRNHFEKIKSKPFEEIFLDWKHDMKIEGKTITLLDVSRKSGSEYIVKDLLNDGRLLIKDPITVHEKIIDNGDSIRYAFD
jgi:BirA family transcriptional regulator, biotin operon repressor / biotin---[acetyl-CoA-carboxylase] ligase